jgi:hypothetical protein
VRAGDWIAQAQPEAPERLVTRVREVLATNPKAKQSGVAEALLDAADVLLRLVLREGDELARERALDLLAADACVTWAFEAAADDPGTLSARAQETMQRLQQVVV